MNQMADQTKEGRSAKMLIGDHAVDKARRIAVFNPAIPTEEVGSIPFGEVEDVHRAIECATAAQRDWRKKTFVERASLLSAGLSLIAENLDEKAHLYSRENGKTVAEAKGELGDIAKRARFTLALAEELDTARTVRSENGRTLVRPIPFGVVVAIAPWNAPVSLACMQVVPALLAGNSVVVKPPESCPLTLIEALELLARDLPPGVLNVVTGLPSVIGDALTKHPGVGKISFVGSVGSAKGIMCNAAETIKSVTFELGGNDPAIVLDDADFSRKTLERMAASVFRMAGQVCMAIKRIYVPGSRYQEFVDAFSAVADAVVVGVGTTPGVTMGPLHSRSALDRAKAIILDARERGAGVRDVGQIPDLPSFQTGHFVRPTIVTDAPEDARVVSEEQFCPVIPILRYDTMDDVVSRANRTNFGLGASVWSQDIDRASRIAGLLEAGTVFVNSHGTNSVNRRAPYGGVKQSGTGRRGGLEGIFEYAQLQTLTTLED